MVVVQDVVDAVGDSIQLLTPRGLSDRVVTGASVNEHADPRPWLEGGEILMTDGMGIVTDEGEQAAFVRRLAEANVAALALGVGPGLTYPEVPDAVLAACLDHALPLVRVPETTPFIRITDVVYSLILSTRATEAQRIAEAQLRLVRAAARPASSPDVLAGLVRLTGLWAQLRESSTLEVVAGELPDWIGHDDVVRAVAGIRHRELRGTAVIPSPVGVTRIQAVGTERLRGYLLYGTPDARLSDDAAALAAFTASLLAIDLERRAAVDELQRRPRSDAARRLLTTITPVAARRILSGFNIDAHRLLVVVVAAPPDPQLLLETTSRHLVEALGTQLQEDVVLIVPESAPDVRRRVQHLTRSLAAGISGSFEAHQLRLAHRQATQAVAVAQRQGRDFVDAMTLGSTPLLLQLGGPAPLRAYADAVVGPIVDAANDRDVDLLDTLTAWYDSSCNAEATAASLGVHRHTVRHRLQRVEEITGRRLDLVRDRSEVWLALEARVVAASLDG